MAPGEQWLLADVGGTGTRLLSAGQPTTAAAEYRNREFPSFAAVVEHHCAATGARPSACAIAAAGPVQADAVHMTNLDWRLSAAELQAQFDWQQVQLVNDFVAQAWATEALSSDELLPLADRPAGPGNRVVLGPGTGLGVAALVRDREQRWTAVSGEGGHVTLAARSPEEHALISAITAQHGHCSAERLLSGPGLSALAAGLGYGTVEPPVVADWAQAGDPRGAHVLRVFAELLGTVASDLAVTFAASGGVYLAGGILPRLGDTFPRQHFLERFYDKGRLRASLEATPILLMSAPQPALRGLELLIAEAT